VLQQLEATRLNLAVDPAKVLLSKEFTINHEDDKEDENNFEYEPRIVEEFEELLKVFPDEFRDLIEDMPYVSDNLIDLKIDEGPVFFPSL
jgi:hypothetical protein